MSVILESEEKPLNPDVRNAMLAVIEEYRGLSDEEYKKRFEDIKLSAVGTIIADLIGFSEFLDNEEPNRGVV